MIQVTFHVLNSAIFINEPRIILPSSISSQTSNFRANPCRLVIEWSGIRSRTDYSKSGLRLNPERQQRHGGDEETPHLKKIKGSEDSIGSIQNIWGCFVMSIETTFDNLIWAFYGLYFLLWPK